MPCAPRRAAASRSARPRPPSAYTGIGVEPMARSNSVQPSGFASGWLAVALTGPSTAKSAPRLPAATRSALSWQEAPTSAACGRCTGAPPAATCTRWPRRSHRTPAARSAADGGCSPAGARRQRASSPAPHRTDARTPAPASAARAVASSRAVEDHPAGAARAARESARHRAPQHLRWHIPPAAQASGSVQWPRAAAARRRSRPAGARRTPGPRAT